MTKESEVVTMITEQLGRDEKKNERVGKEKHITKESVIISTEQLGRDEKMQKKVKHDSYLANKEAHVKGNIDKERRESVNISFNQQRRGKTKQQRVKQLVSSVDKQAG